MAETLRQRIEALRDRYTERLSVATTAVLSPPPDITVEEARLGVDYLHEAVVALTAALALPDGPEPLSAEALLIIASALSGEMDRWTPETLRQIAAKCRAHAEAQREPR